MDININNNKKNKNIIKIKNWNLEVPGIMENQLCVAKLFLMD